MYLYTYRVIRTPYGRLEEIPTLTPPSFRSKMTKKRVHMPKMYLVGRVFNLSLLGNLIEEESLLHNWESS